MMAEAKILMTTAYEERAMMNHYALWDCVVPLTLIQVLALSDEAQKDRAQFNPVVLKYMKLLVCRPYVLKYVFLYLRNSNFSTLFSSFKALGVTRGTCEGYNTAASMEIVETARKAAGNFSSSAEYYRLQCDNEFMFCRCRVEGSFNALHYQ